MGRRKVLSFTCPKNDTHIDPGEDHLFPSGEALMTQLRLFLRTVDVTMDGVSPQDYYGWIAKARLHGRCFDFLLQYPGEYQISFWQTGVFNCLRAKSGLAECLDELSRAISEWIKGDCRGAILKIEEISGPASF